MSCVAELGFIYGNAGILSRGLSRRSLDRSVPVGGVDILFRSILLQDYMLLAVTGLYIRSNGLPNQRDFTP